MQFRVRFLHHPLCPGRARARDFANLLEEARILAQRGVSELVLTGVNIGTYDAGGHTISTWSTPSTRYPASTASGSAASSQPRCRRNPGPHGRTGPPSDAILHLPLQSGIDPVLRVMRRRYTMVEYVEQFASAHDRVPVILGHGRHGGPSQRVRRGLCANLRVHRRTAHRLRPRFPLLRTRRNPGRPTDRSGPGPGTFPTQCRAPQPGRPQTHGFLPQHLGRTMPVLFEDPKPDCWPDTPPTTCGSSCPGVPIDTERPGQPTARYPSRVDRSRLRSRRAGRRLTTDQFRGQFRLHGRGSNTPKQKASLEQATLGGGCFWCLEPVYKRARESPASHPATPTARSRTPPTGRVCEGTTGHAEVIQLTLTPGLISYDQVLDLFWIAHDPTTLNRQGPDSGTQYCSIILTHNEAQQAAAEASRTRATADFKIPS